MFYQLPLSFVTSRPPVLWLFATPLEGSVGVYSRLNVTMKRFLFVPARVQQFASAQQLAQKIPMDVIVM